MTTERFLPGALLVVFTACPAAAQFTGNPYPTPKPYADLVPSVAPLASTASSGPVGMPPYGMPPGRPIAAASYTSPLDQVVPPTPPAPPAAAESTPFQTLTGMPAAMTPPSVPPGSYPGTGWTGGGPNETFDYHGCCGPLGCDGPIGYEVYTDSGPTVPFGVGQFVQRLEVGWMVGAGGRSLFFNQARDAAWVADLGWSYEYNRGNQYSGFNADVRQPTTTNAAGAPVNQPDKVVYSYVRDIDRTSFNWALGRDWWIYGPGSTGSEHGWNLRVGGLVGGRYGTAHIDLVATDNPFDYNRRQNVFEGVFVEVHANVEVPLGSVIWFGGIQVQYGYDWTNLAPPYPGDIQNINCMIHTGFRF